MGQVMETVGCKCSSEASKGLAKEVKKAKPSLTLQAVRIDNTIDMVEGLSPKLGHVMRKVGEALSPRRSDANGRKRMGQLTDEKKAETSPRRPSFSEAEFELTITVPNRPNIVTPARQYMLIQEVKEIVARQLGIAVEDVGDLESFNCRLANTAPLNMYDIPWNTTTINCPGTSFWKDRDEYEQKEHADTEHRIDWRSERQVSGQSSMTRCSQGSKQRRSSRVRRPSINGQSDGPLVSVPTGAGQRRNSRSGPSGRRPSISGRAGSKERPPSKELASHADPAAVS